MRRRHARRDMLRCGSDGLDHGPPTLLHARILDQPRKGLVVPRREHRATTELLNDRAGAHPPADQDGAAAVDGVVYTDTPWLASTCRDEQVGAFVELDQFRRRDH